MKTQSIPELIKSLDEYGNDVKCNVESLSEQLSCLDKQLELIEKTKYSKQTEYIRRELDRLNDTMKQVNRDLVGTLNLAATCSFVQSRYPAGGIDSELAFANCSRS